MVQHYGIKWAMATIIAWCAIIATYLVVITMGVSIPFMDLLRGLAISATVAALGTVAKAAWDYNQRY